MSRAIAFVAAFAGWALPNNATAEDNPTTRLSLTGLPGVRLVVGNIAPDAQRDGLSEEKIREQASARLGKGGIRVLSAEMQRQTPRRPALHVNVATSRLETDEYLYSIHVELIQWVALLENGGRPISAATPVPAKTWSTPNLFGIAPADEVRAHADDAIATMLDEFVKAWRQANPRVPSR
jgi:hypothetical protein